MIGRNTGEMLVDDSFFECLNNAPDLMTQVLKAELDALDRHRPRNPDQL